MSESRIEQFETFLTGRSLRVSRERRIIAEQIFSTSGPFDCDQVLNSLANSSPSRRVSRATVYRTLALLENSGLVKLN